MINRNNSLNRAPKKRLSALQPKIPLKERKPSNVLKSTCVNWNCDLSELTEPKNVLELKQISLKELYFKNKNSNKPFSNTDRETIKQYMRVSIQRAYLNNREIVPGMGEIRNQWPFSLEQEFLHQHFEQLMKIEAKSFKLEFDANKNKLFDFFKSSKIKNVRNIEADDISIVTGLTRYFKEDASFLFIEFEV